MFWFGWVFFVGVMLGDVMGEESNSLWVWLGVIKRYLEEEFGDKERFRGDVSLFINEFSWLNWDFWVYFGEIVFVEDVEDYCG